MILSNCVINLSPEKERVWAEAYRVLRPGGRVQVSDIVLEHPLPRAVLDNVEAWIGCVAGASLRRDYLAAIEAAGFRELRVVREACFGDLISLDDPRIAKAMQEIGLPAKRRSATARPSRASPSAR